MSVIVSGLIFGLCHMQNLFYGTEFIPTLIQSVVAALAGILDAAVYYLGGNIWSLILIHMITDSASGMQYIFLKATGENDAINSLSIVNLVPALVFVLVTVYILRPQKMSEAIDNLRENEN